MSLTYVCHLHMHATPTTGMHMYIEPPSYYSIEMCVCIYPSVWWFIWSLLFKATYDRSSEAFAVCSSLLYSCEKLKANQSFDCLPSTETKSSSYFNWHMQYAPMYAHVDILIRIRLLGYIGLTFIKDLCVSIWTSEVVHTSERNTILKCM